MRKTITGFFLLLILLSTSESSFAQEAKTLYLTGVVTAITKEEKDSRFQTMVQQLKIRVLTGTKRNQEVDAIYQYSTKNTATHKLAINDQVVLMETVEKGKSTYSVNDKYRLTPLIYIVFGFFVLVALIAGKRGLGALLGLGISLVVIVFFIVPQILKGADPLLISIIGSLFIMITTIYLAHGFSRQTSIAIASTFLSLVITGVLAVSFVQLLRLSGLSSEDAYMLQQGKFSIDMQGLLLGGIIIGALGVLDDTTTTQSATIFALSEANEKMKVKDLIIKGLQVGKEHITALVNTLVLAYAGVSLPIFIFLVLNPLNQPIWVILNSEMLVEEIARTIAGSVGLILAVPITTVLAAFFSRYSVKIK